MCESIEITCCIKLNGFKLQNFSCCFKYDNFSAAQRDLPLKDLLILV